MMRGVRFEIGGSVQVVQLPMPQPGPEEVLVRVLAAGVCRTDLRLLDDVAAGTRKPLVPGHEMVGRVTQLGRDVYIANKGDLVVVHFEQPCGECRQCRKKRTNLCQRGTSLGFDAQGGYAEYVKARQTTVLALPQDMDPSLAAPLGCSGATAYRAVATLGQAEKDDLVVVIGSGGVGLSAIQIARTQEARTLAVDVRESARRAALDAGADAATAPEEAAMTTRNMSHGDGADVVVDFVGTRSTFELAKSILGYGGRLVAVAVGSEPVEITSRDIVEGGKAYLGVYSTTMADLARTIALAEAGRLKPIVTRKAPLTQAGEVLADLRAGKIVGRAVLLPGAT